MDLERRAGESRIQHHKRLVDGKLTDKTLADVDYSELSEYVYGQAYSSDVARRMMYGSKKTLDLLDADGIDSASGTDIVCDIDMKLAELKREQQKFYDQRAAYNKLLRDRAREEELNEIIERCVSSGELPRLAYEQHYAEGSDNDLLVSLNDIHYGAQVNNYWNTYNSDICKDMLRRYLDQILTIADRHGCQNCIVWENGDAIHGNIHYSVAVSNKENVIKQIMGVSELIAEFLAELSKHFMNVSFVSVAGNHSRLNPNKDMTLKGERLDDMVEWYLAARLQNFENIHISAGERIDSTMYLIDIRGKTYAGIHGDYDGSAAKVQALQTLAGKPLYAVLSGHLHHNKIDEVQGVRTVMAGSFLGMDDFCVEKRIYGHPEQMVCVCDENGILCHYDVPLNR